MRRRTGSNFFWGSVFAASFCCRITISRQPEQPMQDYRSCDQLLLGRLTVKLSSVAAGFVVLLFSSCLLAQSSGPDDRPITDPQSISSSENLNARPVPIDDLYFTRSLGGASWS